MVSRLTSLSLAAMLAISAASAAGAQDGSEATGARTPESAQRFLGETFTQPDANTSSFTAWEVDEQRVAPDAAGAKESYVSGKLAALAPSSRCVSNLSYKEGQLGGRWPPGDYEEPLDWSKLVQVEKTNVTNRNYTYDSAGQRNGEKVTSLHGIRLIMRNGGSFSFATPVEAERDRAAFAAEFLKDACTARSDTGF